MKKSTIALVLLAIFATPTYAEKIDSLTTNESIQGALISITEDTVFTNFKFFDGPYNNPYPFNMKGDHKVTVRSDDPKNFLFLEGAIDVKELVVEAAKYSPFNFGVGGGVGRDYDEVDAFHPTIKADRLAITGSQQASLVVRSAADVDVGSIEVPSLNQYGGTLRADYIKATSLRVDGVYRSDWTPASQLSLVAESVDANSVTIVGTPGGNNAKVNLDIGTLTVGGFSPDMTLTNVPAGIERLVISGTDPERLGVVRLEGENSFNEVVIQSNAAFYQKSMNGAYQQAQASLSIKRLEVQDGASLRVGGMKTLQGSNPSDGLFDDRDVVSGIYTNPISAADFAVNVDELVLDAGSALHTRINGSTMSQDVNKTFHIDTLTVDLTTESEAQSATVHTNGTLDADRIVVRTDDTSKTFVVTNDQVVDGTINELDETQQEMAATIAGDAKIQVVGNSTLNNGSRTDVELLSDLAGTLDLGRTKLNENNRIQLVAEEGEVMGSLEALADWTPDATGDSGTVSIDNGTIVRRENEKTSGIAEVAAITFLQWRAELDDMEGRLGDLRNTPQSNGLWVRTYGGKHKYGTQSVDMDNTGLQMGYDRRVSSAQGQVFVGGAASWTDMDGDFTRGTAEGHTLAFTGYATWLLDSGLYVDAIAKYGMLQNRFNVQQTAVPYHGKLETQFVAASVQTGMRFALPAGFFAEPQLQFTAGHIFGDDYRTSHGLEVTQESFDSIIGRAGVAAGWTFPEAKGSIFGKISYLYDFDAEQISQFTMAGNGQSRYENDLGGGWWEAEVGAQWRFSDACFGYAEFAYGDGGDVDSPYRWSVGLRYAF